jgi:hypothetical protein
VGNATGDFKGVAYRNGAVGAYENELYEYDEPWAVVGLASTCTNPLLDSSPPARTWINRNLIVGMGYVSSDLKLWEWGGI